MTRKALRPEERRPLLWGRREMRIMATGAGHLISAHALARALGELLDLAYPANSKAIFRINIKG